MMYRILFQGDSITDCGRDRNDFFGLGEGYVKFAKAQLLDVEVINRGVSGDRVCDLKKRWNDDCIALKPDILCVLIGINDVWRTIDSGAESDDKKFDEDYRFILERLKVELPETKIVILEPFLLKTGAGNVHFRELLNKKIDIIRDIARDYADAFIPLDGIFQSYRMQKSDEELIPDGVHPSLLGHEIIAHELTAWLSNDIIANLKKKG